MSETATPGGASLAEIAELDALKVRYQAFDDQMLLKWVEVVTGTHRDAMAELLRERGTRSSDKEKHLWKTPQVLSAYSLLGTPPSVLGLGLRRRRLWEDFFFSPPSAGEAVSFFRAGSCLGLGACLGFAFCLGC